MIIQRHSAILAWPAGAGCCLASPAGALAGPWLAWLALTSVVASCTCGKISDDQLHSSLEEIPGSIF